LLEKEKRCIFVVWELCASIYIGYKNTQFVIKYNELIFNNLNGFLRIKNAGIFSVGVSGGDSAAGR
jgi:hypothetical protein